MSPCTWAVDTPGTPASVHFRLAWDVASAGAATARARAARPPANVARIAAASFVFCMLCLPLVRGVAPRRVPYHLVGSLTRGFGAAWRARLTAGDDALEGPLRGHGRPDPGHGGAAGADARLQRVQLRRRLPGARDQEGQPAPPLRHQGGAGRGADRPLPQELRRGARGDPAGTRRRALAPVALRRALPLRTAQAAHVPVRHARVGRGHAARRDARERGLLLLRERGLAGGRPGAGPQERRAPLRRRGRSLRELPRELAG